MKLVPTDSISPALYNPRTVDNWRLDLIQLSLRKLGFVLPIYVHKDTGEILSGHQRHFVAVRMGLPLVPVEYVGKMSEEKRKAVNIVFNRGTNDLTLTDTCESVRKRLVDIDVFSIAESIEDAIDLYPCMNCETRDVLSLARKNVERQNEYSRSIAKTLIGQVGVTPIVITKDGRVVNGLGRLFALAQIGKKFINCVVVPDDKANFADIMLNLVSMDFNIHEKYKNELRYNSFRRSITTRRGLGLGFFQSIWPALSSGDVVQLSGKMLREWSLKYGKTVVDFGAGRLTDTAILKKAGVDVVPFEPYLCDANVINRERSVALAKDFLAQVRSGKQFSSVFVSSVMNSVPFRADREKIVAICHALCSPSTVFTLYTMSVSHNNYIDTLSPSRNRDNSAKIKFRLDYEPGITIGDLSGHPKAQKFHTSEQVVSLCSPFFHSVKIKKLPGNLLAECTRPKEINPAVLRDALKFEFDLPYPGGLKMGLAEEALSAFSERLEVEL